MQIFYYTLVNMLKIDGAKHVLEIACGIGKLIPYAISLKNQECTYLASDLSENMVHLAKKYIAGYIDKMGGSESIDSWTKKHSLEFKALNGEEPF